MIQLSADLRDQRSLMLALVRNDLTGNKEAQIPSFVCGSNWNFRPDALMVQCVKTKVDQLGTGWNENLNRLSISTRADPVLKYLLAHLLAPAVFTLERCIEDDDECIFLDAALLAVQCSVERRRHDVSLDAGVAQVVRERERERLSALEQ